MARLVKYMGLADVRTIKKGTDFGGQLRDKTTADLVFNAENNWVLDVEDLGLSSEAIDLLLSEEERGSVAFKDVTDLKMIPRNANQKTFNPTARDRVNTEVADVGTPAADGLGDLSVRRLRQLASENNVEIPDDVTDKDDIVSRLREANVSAS